MRLTLRGLFFVGVIGAVLNFFYASAGNALDPRAARIQYTVHPRNPHFELALAHDVTVAIQRGMRELSSIERIHPNVLLPAHLITDALQKNLILNLQTSVGEHRQRQIGRHKNLGELATYAIVTAGTKAVKGSSTVLDMALLTRDFAGIYSTLGPHQLVSMSPAEAAPLWSEHIGKPLMARLVDRRHELTQRVFDAAASHRDYDGKLSSEEPRSRSMHETMNDLHTWAINRSKAAIAYQIALPTIATWRDELLQVGSAVEWIYTIINERGRSFLDQVHQFRSADETMMYQFDTIRRRSAGEL